MVWNAVTTCSKWPFPEDPFPETLSAPMGAWAGGTSLNAAGGTDGSAGCTCLCGASREGPFGFEANALVLGLETEVDVEEVAPTVDGDAGLGKGTLPPAAAAAMAFARAATGA